MSARRHHDFDTTDLNPDLLSLSFEVQTRWHAITGAPCSGKTTLTDRLAAQGFRTVPEAGRLYVEGEMSKRRTMDQLLEDGAAMQRGVLDLQVRLERRLPANEVAFLDSGAPTSLPTTG